MSTTVNISRLRPQLSLRLLLLAVTIAAVCTWWMSSDGKEDVTSEGQAKRVAVGQTIDKLRANIGEPFVFADADFPQDVSIWEYRVLASSSEKPYVRARMEGARQRVTGFYRSDSIEFVNPISNHDRPRFPLPFPPVGVAVSLPPPTWSIRARWIIAR